MPACVLHSRFPAFLYLAAMTGKRIQLTLFVPPPQSASIEAVRLAFNPVQQRLIKSHITLCREDELVPLSAVLSNLQNLRYPVLSLELGHAIRFQEGRGVLLPIVNGTNDFRQLRETVLRGIHNHPKLHEPHLTLLHPRNATCTDGVFTQIQRTALPAVIVFDKISLIEQEEGGPWVTVDEFALGKADN